MTLRVLPSLSEVVTTDDVRRRKRVAMLLPGLAAFALYRLAKQTMPISNIWVLVPLSGFLSSVTALVAYQSARRIPVHRLWNEDGMGRMSWIAGWIGFAYGMQLSLMVLALLKVVVHYDFLVHPDGPAMMAMVIACTSVSRDAFEIGHIRWLQDQGEPVLTFPDGAAMRRWLRFSPVGSLPPMLVAAVLTAMVCLLAAEVGSGAASNFGQLLIASGVSGTLALGAFLHSKQPVREWRGLLHPIAWSQLFRFWWWPGLAFAATYYLTLQGVVLFMLEAEMQNRVVQGLMAGVVAAAMTLYCSYLGHRRAIEDRVRQTIPHSLLRCPFVLNILSKGSDRSRMPADPPTRPDRPAPEPLPGH